MFIFCILGVMTLTCVVITLALCKAASRADRLEESLYKNKKNY